MVYSRNAVGKINVENKQWGKDNEMKASRMYGVDVKVTDTLRSLCEGKRYSIFTFIHPS